MGIKGALPYMKENNGFKLHGVYVNSSIVVEGILINISLLKVDG